MLIAGPSSSGKTTTSKRIATQLKVLGLRPVILEMDNYFLNRTETPRDENGAYNFETIRAMDVPFLNEQLTSLLEGREVEIPYFDFLTGTRSFRGKN